MPLFSNNNESQSSDSPTPRNSNHEDREPQEQSAPADEHTRLLPNRLDSSRGMLRPDDPAVTPYNLWTIKILRFLTLAFTMLTFVWWLLLLVSVFTTPPGFHTRGSGFYAFGFASFAFANMLFTLIFFGVPAKSVRILAVVMAVGCSNLKIKNLC